jgi:hypothetical protein
MVRLYLQTAIDQGGPRKEFFALLLSAIKEKYFDKGLRDFMPDDYTVIGKVMGKKIFMWPISFMWPLGHNKAT